MFAVTLALMLAAQPQAMQASAQPDIFVTAPRRADVATVQRFVREISTTTDGQLASMRAPVCPAVFGMPSQFAARVARRIRSVAAEAGMQVAGEGCTPNVTLIFANNSARAIEEMQRLRPRLFNGLEPGEYQALTRGRNPVRVWSLTEVRNEDGTDLAPGSNDEAAASSGASSLRVTSSSIITLPTQRVITQSVVVMEEQATVGKTLSQIADYAAMRAIAGARSGGDVGAGNSILSLFDSAAEAPRSLTSLDLAYLRALQSTRGNQRAGAQMSRISRLISGELSPQSAR